MGATGALQDVMMWEEICVINLRRLTLEAEKKGSKVVGAKDATKKIEKEKRNKDGFS